MAQDNPYASPLSVQEDAGAISQPGPVHPFQDASGLGNFAWMFILLMMLIDAAVIAFRFNELNILDSVMQGNRVDLAAAQLNDQYIRLAELGRLPLLLLTVIPFLMWMYRCHRNLPALGAAGLQQSPGWAVGGWFIPFANLILPYRAMQEIYRGSDPRGLLREPNRLGSPSLLVTAWWMTYIGSGICAIIGANMIRMNLVPGGRPDLPMLKVASTFLIVTSGLRLVAGACIIAIIRNVNRNQDVRHERKRRADQTTAQAGISFT